MPRNAQPQHAGLSEGVWSEAEQPHFFRCAWPLEREAVQMQLAGLHCYLCLEIKRLRGHLQHAERIEEPQERRNVRTVLARVP